MRQSKDTHVTYNFQIVTDILHILLIPNYLFEITI